MSDIAIRPPADRTVACTGNLLVDFYDRLPRVIAASVPDPAPVVDPHAFSPGFELPKMDEKVRRFLSVADVAWRPLTRYGGRRISLLDLTGNPGTNTTKTFPSLLIVARAVEYIRRTGEPVLIFSPTSANKGVALRDAVLRAIECELVTPEQLRVAVLAPWGCSAKLRATRLGSDPWLRELNPLFVYRGERPEMVKTLGRAFVDEYGRAVRRRTGLNVWYSLDLSNYLIADTTRAFFEDRVSPSTGSRLHVHAVSSAFGMLGYHRGRALLEEAGEAEPETRPATLLVQHLAAPDMVLHLRHKDFSAENAPRYVLDPSTSLYRQYDDPRFPSVTYDPAEILDPTFYTRQPQTSPAMDEIIDQYGGDGIVVSLAECLAAYPRLRTFEALRGRGLPRDFRDLREWSLVMALTGTMNAIDRGLADEFSDVVVHGSGSYSVFDYDQVTAEMVVPVDSAGEIAARLSR